MDLNSSISLLLSLNAKIYHREQRLIQQVPIHSFNYTVLQAIAKILNHTKEQNPVSGTSGKLPLT